MQPSGPSPLDWKRALALAACLAVGVACWNLPVMWPLKILVVMMHESGHALATLLVGGHVQRVTIAANQSGQCVSALPPGAVRQIVIYSAGYVGSAVAGGLLLIATLRFRVRRAVLGAMCLWLGAMGVLFAGDTFTLLFCLGTALVVAVAAKWLPTGAVEVLNIFIAAFTGLYSLFDLRDDLWNSAARAQSDAALLADLTFVPSVVWAAVWTVAAAVILVLCGWWSVKPRRRNVLAAPSPAGA